MVGTQQVVDPIPELQYLQYKHMELDLKHCRLWINIWMDAEHKRLNIWITSFGIEM